VRAGRAQGGSETTETEKGIKGNLWPRKGMPKIGEDLKSLPPINLISYQKTTEESGGKFDSIFRQLEIPERGRRRYVNKNSKLVKTKNRSIIPPTEHKNMEGAVAPKDQHGCRDLQTPGLEHRVERDRTKKYFVTWININIDCFHANKKSE